MLQPDKLKKLNENATKMYEAGSSEEDILAMKDAFIKQFGVAEPEKKNTVGSLKNQIPPQDTTVLPMKNGLSATPLPPRKAPKEQYFESPDGGEGVINKTINWLGGVQSEAAKSVFTFADDVIVSARKGLQEQGFFDDDIPDTDTPITDAIKNKVSAKKAKTLTFEEAGIDTKAKSDGGPLDPTPLIKSVASLGLKIINSTLPQSQKNIIIAALNLGSAQVKNAVKRIDTYQENALPEDSISTDVVKGIVGMVPDLLVASALKTPAAAEGSIAKFGTKISEGARPLLKKYVPKVAKFVEEAVRAPFTKIMAGKGIVSGIASAEEGEDIIDAGFEGGVEGAVEGMYMHALGVAAGKTMPFIAKGISKAGINSAISTAIASPLANAGVFATAKAIRTPIETGEFATGRELLMEAGTGVGFSLLHAGSQFKTHNEANHYYDNTLKTDPLQSLGRVLNETKENLDLVYKPDLTETQIKDLEQARDEIKTAILREPDLNNKKLLGDEALKIQNQLDANSSIKGILENKQAIIEKINSSEDLNDELKSFYTKKIEAMADHFDTSEFGLKKKELNAKIEETQKLLDDASSAFTNRKSASDGIEAKLQVDKRRAELDALNEELTNLITNKDAIQKQTTDESVLRTEQPELELQGVGEGNIKPVEVTEETITTSQPEEVKGTFLDNILGKIYEYTDPITGDKLKGNIFFDGQEVVFTDSNKEFSLGTVQDVLNDNSLNAKEVTPNFNISEDGGITILKEIDGVPEGKITPQGAGLKAIKTDKNGNVKRVVITDANGVTHSIKGELANDLAEVMMFDLAKQGGLTKKINSDATARESFNRGVREANAKRKSKNTQGSVQGLDRGGRTGELTPAPETVAEVVTEPTPVAETPVVEVPVAEAPVVETPAVEEVTTEADLEQDIASNLIRRQDSEGIKNEKDVNHNSPKIEYNGDSKRIKELVDKYNNLTRKVEEDGSFSTLYGARLIEKLIRKGLNSNQTRKLSSALRKAGLLNATSSQLESGSGGIGTYISDTSGNIASAYANELMFSATDRLSVTKILTKLAKELGVDVASLETEANRKVEKIGVETKAEAKAEPTPVAEGAKAKPISDKVQQRIAQIDNAIDVLFETNGPDTSTWVNPASNYDLITLRRAKKAFESDAQSVKTFLNSRMGERYSEIEFKFEDLKEAPTPKPKAKPKAAPKTKFEDKAKKIADEIMKLELPDWAVAEGAKGAANQGVDSTVLKRAFADSVIKLGQLMDAGVEFSKALKEASKDLVGLLGQKNRDRIEDEILNKFNKGEKLSEKALKGYDSFSSNVDKAISNGKTIDNVLNYMNKSDVYKRANDVQKELLIREVNKKFGLSQKSAPSVGKLFGTIKDIAKITMTEKAALIKQITDLARGGKGAQKAIKEATQTLIDEVTELRQGGKINKPQEQAILNRLAKTNVLSETSVKRYVDYVSKVYADAEYSAQLSKAKDTKSDINSLSKNKDKNASLKELGKEFAKIDPSMVDDIYAYNDIASKIKTALTGSKIRGQKVNFADTVNIDEAINFTKKAIDSQAEKLREERIAELQDLLGVDASKFSAEEIDALLKGEKEFKGGDDEKIARATINKAFDIYSSVIKEVISTGKDTFTDEPIEFTKTQKELVAKFMDMDLGLLEKKDALSAVDALQNFLVNKSTAKMDAVVRGYQGIKNIKELTTKGIKSRELTKYGVKVLGRQLADKITSLPVVFEKMFPGLSRSGEVMNKIGLTELFNKRSATLTEGNNIVDDFVNKLYKKKANGEDYNTEYNIIERALAAHAIRSLIGTEEQIQKEFEDRKSLIDQSITELSKGSDKEKKLGELYKKAYDKILKDSNNADEVLAKTDKNNVEGVDFWIEEYAKKYDRSADVSENIYNTKLDRDLNYTPMKYSNLETNTKEVELDNDQSSFHTNNGSVIVPKTGSLNEIQRLSVLPKGKYVDLSFDKNMANSMYDLLTDINTAGPIRQIKAAINSPEFDKLVPHTEDRALLKGSKKKMGRIELYVKNIRNKNPYSTSEDMKTLNRVAAIGVGQALAGLGQPFKQTIPVAISTFINTKGELQLGATFNPDKLSFINNSGYSIANRGRQSQAEIESVNRLIEKSEGSTGSKAIKFIEKANELQLKYLLEKPDVYIAKAAWLTYYEEALKQQGENVKDIDYSKHELNEDAANYAQRQVDRQQNISDQDLAGRLFTDKTSYAQVLIKMLMPFSSFRMNASAKFGADMITLKDKTSSKEDRAIAKRSIAGYAAEMAVFRAVSIGSSLLIGSLVNKYLGKDESEEEFQKRKDAMVKGAITGTFTDLFSPIPVLDAPVQQVGAEATKIVDDLMGTNIAIYDVPKKDFLKEYGTLGISLDRLGKLWALGNLAATGKYVDDFGKEKEISEEDRMSLVPLVPLSLATDVGLAPTEINTAINYAVKFSKKSKEGMSQEQLKKSNPKLYERLYGKESANYRANQRMKEREAEIKARMKRD